jgi:hypothetical protein
VRRLTPHRDAILTWLYQTIAAKSRDRGALPMWVFVPQSRTGTWMEETAPAEQLALAAGMKTVDMSEIFATTPFESIRLAEWDDHPNKLGHDMLAEALLRELTREASPIDSAIKAKR